MKILIVVAVFVLAGCASLATKQEEAGLKAEIRRLEAARAADQEALDAAIRSLNDERAKALEAGDSEAVDRLESQIVSQSRELNRVKSMYEGLLDDKRARLDGVIAKKKAEKIEGWKFGVEKVASFAMIILSLIGGAVKP